MPVPQLDPGRGHRRAAALHGLPAGGLEKLLGIYFLARITLDLFKLEPGIGPLARC